MIGDFVTAVVAVILFLCVVAVITYRYTGGGRR